jgi:hypothetical protein
VTRLSCMCSKLALGMRWVCPVHGDADPCGQCHGARIVPGLGDFTDQTRACPSCQAPVLEGL